MDVKISDMPDFSFSNCSTFSVDGLLTFQMQNVNGCHRKKGPPVVHKAFGLNLSTILLNYTLPFDMNDILVPLDLINYSREWIPCNFPPNLNDGMILWKYDVEPSLNLIKLSILTGEQIEQKTLDWELLYEPVNPIDCSIWFGCGSNAFLMLNPSIVAPLVRAEAVNSRDCVLTYLFYRC
ncbi:hypothetical protein M3Y98_00708000 [Aphelenchoides besseyi]|nr:hypothetical protein M3Y98_00708000 [Aphelenchoides besseyi]